MKTAILVLCVLAAVPVSARGEPNPAPPGAGTARVVEIVGGNYFFRPDRVTVKVNEPVEFRVRQEPGAISHNFVIDAPQAGVRIKEPIDRDARSIRATFTAPGEYTFYCSRQLLFFKSHQERGMAGTIEVTP